MMDWLFIAFVALAGFLVWLWTPPPANWVMGAGVLLCCLLAAYALLRGLRGRSLVAVGFGFLIVVLVPAYDWGFRAIAASSDLWSKHGLAILAFVFVVMVPLIGALASQMLFSSGWKPLGIALLAGPAILGLVAGIAYWLLFIVGGSSGRVSSDQRQLFALLAIPVLATIAVFLGLAAHRAWLGQLDSFRP